jgi:hypothetical protein
MPNREYRLIFALATVVLMTACVRPETVTVRDGADPVHADQDVAFRTVYYFRVFDYCTEKILVAGDASTIVVPRTDSLYRFRMTGKSNTIFSNIKFEAGTLRAWQIDPFGARIEYDKDTGRHRYVSPEEAKGDTRRAKARRRLAELEHLRGKREKSLIDRFKADGLAISRAGIATDPTIAAFDTAIQRTIRDLASETGIAPVGGTTGRVAGQTNQIRSGNSDPPATIDCPDEAPVRRGFQVLGPEGWRTFDQDERLILAMTSSAQPLVSTMNDLSNRVLNARARPEAVLLPLAEERTRLSEATRVLDAKSLELATGEPLAESPSELARAVCTELVKASMEADEKADAKQNKGKEICK